VALRVSVVHSDLPHDTADAFFSASQVAWDTETTGLDWRHDRLATCQLFTESVGAVLISMGPDGHKPERLAALLEDPAVEKVFHHAPFDLRFMMNTWSVRPASVRCTKVASKLLDSSAPNERHSLQQLAKQHLGVALSKGPVRTSDWTKTDLTPEQVDYAAGDVAHLLPLFRLLSDALRQMGLSGLYDDCCAFLPARAALELGGYPDVFAY
jgi:ribonuclease D